MKQYNVAVLVGSLRKDSHNLKLAKALTKLASPKLNMHIIKIDDLPLFNQDLEANFPQSALRLKEGIKSSDAVLFICPEYNRGVTAPLKNAIDWASRPYGESVFSKKPAALCGISFGAIGTACAQSSLKPTLYYLDVLLMGQPEVYLQFKEDLIDFDGTINNTGTENFLQGFVDSFYNWIKTVSL